MRFLGRRFSRQEKIDKIDYKLYIVSIVIYIRNK